MKSCTLLIALLSSLLITKSVQGQRLGWEWAKGGNNPGNASGSCIATDNAGNVYTTGYFFDSITFDTRTLISRGLEDIFLVKYAADGTFQWATRAGGAGKDLSNGIATDPFGNIVICGYYTDTADFQGKKIGSVARGVDIFTTKYNSDGDVVWAKSAGGNRPDYGFGIAIDKSGNVYITGGYGEDGGSPPSHWTATFDTSSITSIGGTDAFFAKYDTGGHIIWAKSAGGIFFDLGWAIAVDSFYNIYLLGNFTDPWIKFDTAKLNSTNMGFMAGEGYVAKFDSALNFLWARTVSGSQRSLGSGGAVYTTSFAVDAAGNSFVGGTFDNCTIKAGGLSVTGRITDRIFIVSFDPSGAPVWGRTVGGGTIENCLTIDKYSNVYIAGYFGSPGSIFDTDTLLPNGDGDVFITKYDKNGREQWVMQGGGRGEEASAGLCADALGNLYTTGAFNSNPGEFGTHPVSYVDGTDVFTAKLSVAANSVCTISKENEVWVYPNPSTEILHFKTRSGFSHIGLLDPLGRFVYEQSFSSAQTDYSIDIRSIANGIYYIKFSSDHLSITRKILIQH